MVSLWTGSLEGLCKTPQVSNNSKPQTFRESQILYTPVRWLASQNKTIAVTLLLQRGANLHEAIGGAAEGQHTFLMWSLIEQADDRATALLAAIFGSAQGQSGALIEALFNPSAKIDKVLSYLLNGVHPYDAYFINQCIRLIKQVQQIKTFNQDYFSSLLVLLQQLSDIIQQHAAAANAYFTLNGLEATIPQEQSHAFINAITDASAAFTLRQQTEIDQPFILHLVDQCAKRITLPTDTMLTLLLEVHSFEYALCAALKGAARSGNRKRLDILLLFLPEDHNAKQYWYNAAIKAAEQSGYRALFDDLAQQQLEVINNNIINPTEQRQLLSDLRIMHVAAVSGAAQRGSIERIMQLLKPDLFQQLTDSWRQKVFNTAIKYAAIGRQRLLLDELTPVEPNRDKALSYAEMAIKGAEQCGARGLADSLAKQYNTIYNVECYRHSMRCTQHLQWVNDLNYAWLYKKDIFLITPKRVNLLNKISLLTNVEQKHFLSLYLLPKSKKSYSASFLKNKSDMLLFASRLNSFLLRHTLCHNAALMTTYSMADAWLAKAEVMHYLMHKKTMNVGLAQRILELNESEKTWLLLKEKIILEWNLPLEIYEKITSYFLGLSWRQIKTVEASISTFQLDERVSIALPMLSSTKEFLPVWPSFYVKNGLVQKGSHFLDPIITSTYLKLFEECTTDFQKKMVICLVVEAIAQQAYQSDLLHNMITSLKEWIRSSINDQGTLTLKTIVEYIGEPYPINLSSIIKKLSDIEKNELRLLYRCKEKFIKKKTVTSESDELRILLQTLLKDFLLHPASNSYAVKNVKYGYHALLVHTRSVFEEQVIFLAILSNQELQVFHPIIEQLLGYLGNSEGARNELQQCLALTLKRLFPNAQCRMQKEIQLQNYVERFSYIPIQSEIEFFDKKYHWNLLIEFRQDFCLKEHIFNIPLIDNIDKETSAFKKNVRLLTFFASPCVPRQLKKRTVAAMGYANQKTAKQVLKNSIWSSFYHQAKQEAKHAVMEYVTVLDTQVIQPLLMNPDAQDPMDQLKVLDPTTKAADMENIITINSRP